jgi:hypothetical protein
MKSLIASICILGIVGMMIGTMAKAGNVVTCTVTPGAYSVSVSPDSVGYGGMTLSATKASGTITATNDGTIATKLLINGSNATYVAYTWTLSTSIGVEDAYLHAYTTDLTEASGTAIGADYTTEWEDLLTGNSDLAASVAVSGNQTFQLDMRTPASVSGGLGNSFTTTVTVTATAP